MTENLVKQPTFRKLVKIGKLMKYPDAKRGKPIQKYADKKVKEEETMKKKKFLLNRCLSPCFINIKDLFAIKLPNHSG